MEKYIIGFSFSLLLINGGLTGFFYLIKIDGAGPEMSWGIGMGPFIVGLFLLLLLLVRKGDKEGDNENILP